MFFFYVETV